ncbi:MAG: amidase [Chloroflexi bacterium]|nr:amidase [Chloroflexota bacterium]
MVKYELTSVELPKLTGRPLRAFARALEIKTSRALMLPQLLDQAGITKLQSIPFDEVPSFYPFPQSDQGLNREPTPPELLESTVSGLPDNGRSLPFTTIQDYAAAYRSGKTTPTAVAEKLFAAIAASDEGNQPIRAFIANYRDDVMAQAKAATERIQAGNPLSIFDGVPVAIKDEVDQVPYPTTVGTTFMGTSPATTDATVVARLRAQGALLFGKANMHEIGINPNGLNVHYDPVRNPYHRGHDPGGSSSGSAAAVAAGLCPVAIGADGGGSIRVPAALCGMVGLKATFGRISEHGAAPLTWSMGHLGPIGASVADVALTYAAIAGPDVVDPMTFRQTAVSLQNWSNSDLNGIRLGVYRPWFEHATPEIVAANEAMLQKLVDAGATLVEIEIPGLDEMRIAHAITILAEMATNMDKYAQHHGKHGAAVRVNLTLGRAFGSQDYLRSQQMRTRAMQIFAKVYEKVDVVVTPATAVTAPPIPTNGLPHGWSDLTTETEIMRFIVPGNFVGLPAISIPVGYDANGLPIGMHLMGRHWEENLLLQVAYAAEQVVERKRPSTFYEII